VVAGRQVPWAAATWPRLMLLLVLLLLRMMMLIMCLLLQRIREAH
jgi:hypothetical protein